MAAKRRMAQIKQLNEQWRGGTAEELQSKGRSFSEQLFRLKFQLANGQKDTIRRIRELRRDIARVKTILREKELASAKGQ